VRFQFAISATSFLSFGYKKTAVKCSIFTTVRFRFLFSFGRNHQQQIVAKAAGKVKVFHRKIEEKIKEG